MNNKKYLTWSDVRMLLFKLNIDPDKAVFGVPRGGTYVAALHGNCVDNAADADIIIDDLIDSGKTRDAYKAAFPKKPFLALLDKRKMKDKDWYVFPWEITSTEGAQPTDNFVRILQYLGEDPDREGLKDTPKRYLKFLREFLTPPEFNFTTFENEGNDQMIVQSNIPFFSLCEHHIAPFFGTGAIAYIPDGKIVGLSKLARTLDLFSRRLQNQERITTQVAEYLQDKLQTEHVAVTLKAQHLCMAMRGVKKHNTHTTTSFLGGAFKEPEVRQEFYMLAKEE